MAIAIHPGRRMSATLSRVAGRYELQEKLGEGGMGVVWRALDTKTGGDVAIKIMKDISDPAALELFTKEWKALAEMCHPNIVDVRDVDILEEDKERKPFFVMPLLRGATLAELIANASARLTVARMVEITSQVCRGLQAAHQRGLIHRDLKPSNIFVMDDDTAKIIDFGVVFLAGSHSVTGQKGTFQYMSPEQVQMKDVTPASDIFALGVILYEGLTGRKPFACSTIEETMQAVMRRTPPSVSEINATIPQAIGRVVHKCLAKQPMHRFSSARELSETLQKAFRNESVFDVAKLQPRIERAKAAFKAGDEAFASDVLAEMESEGHLEPEITVLRMQIETATKQKKIRQLLESARARIEQEEIPLGLDKIREVLELDPENADALALRSAAEKQRSEAQVGKWLELANLHLGNRDFGAARHAVQEALMSRKGDARALDLLGRIDATEIEAKRIREQKEQLYSTAMKAYQNGEIDAALSRLVRLFSVVRANPEAAIPERDAVYESFYKEVRSEHDGICSRLEEAQHQFSESNFGAALALCGDHLAKYPNDGAFQALKIQIEDKERHEVSAYIAGVSKNVEAEPDLDRRANILREAAERYPSEAQFAQQLKVVRERRDLVNSIVAKARQFDERGQYAEALSQWDILRNIHPRFPGLAFELEQCKIKRDRLANEEEKARLVEEIVSLMESRAFIKALEQARLALQGFAGDAELAGLEQLATDGLARSQESRRLFDEGQQAAAERDWLRATELLQAALRLDPRNSGMRDAVIQVLTEQARTLVETHWPEAERLYQQASALDENHRAVRVLGSAIEEARRQTYVGESLTQARALMATGDLQGAQERIQKARREYPKDARLEQFEANLAKNSPQRQLREERGRSWAELAEARRLLEQEPDQARARNLLEMSRAVRAQHPDDPETMHMVAEVEQTIRRVTRQDDLSQLLDAGTEIPQASQASRQSLAAASAYSHADMDGTKVFSSEAASAQPQAAIPARRLAATKAALAQAWVRMHGVRMHGIEVHGIKLRGLAIGAGALAMMTPVVIVWMSNSHHAKHATAHSRKSALATQLDLVIEPGGSFIEVDGVPVSGARLSIPAGQSIAVEVSHLGYKTRTLQLSASDAKSSPRVVLEPEAVRVSIETDEKSGAVEVDGQRVGELVGGELDGLDVPADAKSHTLALVKAGKPLATLVFQANPGERPQLTSVSNKDLVVIASLGTDATFYGGAQLKSAAMGSRHFGVKNAGVDLPPLSDQAHELSYGEGPDASTLSLAIASWPSLIVRSLAAEPGVRVTANIEKAVLAVNGAVLERGKHGWQMTGKPGTYNFALTADGYEPQNWTTLLRAHQTVTKSLTLAPKAAAPTMATLAVAGGTPASEIDVDGKRLGDLDANGAAQFARLLPAGPHTLLFRKAGFCDTRSIDVEAKPPAELSIGDVRLSQCGTISVQTGIAATSPATIKVRRAGYTKWLEVAAAAKVPVAAGEYELVADSAGSKAYSTRLKVEPGQNTDVLLKFTALQGCQLQDAGQATADGEWLKAKNSGSFLYLKAGCTSTKLVFTKPKTGGFAGLLGKGHVQWVIETADGSGRVQYELEDGKLLRKANVSHQTVDAREINVGNATDAKSTTYSVRIHVDGSHVRVTDERGATLDEYTNPLLHDLAGGKLGLKTNAAFMVRSSNE